MEAKILGHRPLYANEFLEGLLGNYYPSKDTVKEVNMVLNLVVPNEHIKIDTSLTLNRMDKLEPGEVYVLVQFSTEFNYTVHRYLWVKIPKKRVSLFKQNIKGWNLQDGFLTEPKANTEEE